MNPSMSIDECNELRSAALTGLPEHFAIVSWAIPSVKNSILKLFLEEMSEECKSLCTGTKGN